MNENELTVEGVRLVLGEKANARGHRNFTKEAREVAVRFAVKRMQGGVSEREAATELGLKGWTLRRWLQRHRREGKQAGKTFHQIEVKVAPTKSVVVHGASGVRVEGLSIQQMALLLRELSCLG